MSRNFDIDNIQATADAIQCHSMLFSLSEEGKDCLRITGKNEKDEPLEFLLYIKDEYVRTVSGPRYGTAWKEIKRIDWERDPIFYLCGQRLRGVKIEKRRITDHEVKTIMRRLPLSLNKRISRRICMDESSPLENPGALLRHLIRKLSEDARDVILVRSPRRRYVIYRKGEHLRVVPEAKEAPCTWKAIQRIDQDHIDPITSLFAENLTLTVAQILPVGNPVVKEILRRLPDSQRTTFEE